MITKQSYLVKAILKTIFCREPKDLGFTSVFFKSFFGRLIQSTVTMDLCSLFYRTDFYAIRKKLLKDVYQIERHIHVKNEILDYIIYLIDDTNRLNLLGIFILCLRHFVYLLTSKKMVSETYP